jgi:hypothetical protein
MGGINGTGSMLRRGDEEDTTEPLPLLSVLYLVFSWSVFSLSLRARKQLRG